MKRSSIAVHTLLLTAGASAFAASSPVDEFIAAKPAALQPLFATLIAEGERNAVLNFNRLGLAAMQRGELEIAERAFDESLQRIESIYANDPQARQAKSKFSEEKVKDFKGEPYERAMAYYYRGLLYLAKGDYENARASFVSGEYQDTLSEKEEFAGDFAVLSYLAGWSSQCAGDLDRAAAFYEIARAAQPSLTAPAPEHKSLVVIDAGAGPRKTASGKHKELLEFVAGDPGSAPSLISPNAELTPVLGSDIGWQASTRGGRPIQAILNNKVQWKEATQGVADVAGAVSTAASTASLMSTDLNQSADFANAGLVAAGIGLFANIAASAMKPAADTRYWETLPGGVYVATASPEAGVEWNVRWRDAQAASPQLSATAGACSIVWASSAAEAPITASAPNSALFGSKRQAKATRAKNEALTASVLSW